MLRSTIVGILGTLAFLVAAAGFGATLTGCSCDDTVPNNDCYYPTK